jgi:hypothetical protein
MSRFDYRVRHSSDCRHSFFESALTCSGLREKSGSSSESCPRGHEVEVPLLGEIESECKG